MPYSIFLLRARRSLWLSGALCLALFSPLAHGEWTKALSLRVEEGYDSNVYLQKVTPQANQDSFITVIQPTIDLGWVTKPFNLNISYSPKASIFGSEHEENNIAHALGINIKGNITDSISYEFLNSLNYVNGSRTAPTFTGPGGPPALGGYQIRDRRESAWMKQSAKVTWTHGWFFLRPVYNGYVHDFKTVQKEIPGYSNYVDRNQFNGGLDLGLKMLKDTWFVTGYRYGSMEQNRLFSSPVQYNNTFHRILFGMEGQPAKWIKLCTTAGPSFHHFDASVPECFGRNHTRVYADATVTLLPTSLDSFVLSTTRFEQLSFYGRGAYQDIIYRAGYVRKLSDTVDFKADFRIYRGEFEAPANRKDNIYTPSIGVNWKVNSHLSCNCQYSYEWAESDVPDTIGREYGHNLASIGANLSF